MKWDKLARGQSKHSQRRGLEWGNLYAAISANAHHISTVPNHRLNFRAER